MTAVANQAVPSGRTVLRFYFFRNIKQSKNECAGPSGRAYFTFPVVVVVVVDGLLLSCGGIPVRMASGHTSLISVSSPRKDCPSTAQRSNDLGQPSPRIDKSSQAASAPLLI